MLLFKGRKISRNELIIKACETGLGRGLNPFTVRFELLSSHDEREEEGKEKSSNLQ